MTFPTNIHHLYHAHIYFNEKSSDFAAQLRTQVTQKFIFSIGRFNRNFVGPHTMWSFSVTFGKDDFEEFVPWLDSARGNLSVLIHAVTGDDFKDHTDFAYWMGKEVELDLTALDLP
ncbi:DOPA 4,5-dioxygenase family protein [Vibrio hepatarius]|uniref:DOPA 4,5-dioxygenase family protein n=1 Tax=Vibrio hepatarius TaxID=171383 RepID=UPI001C09A80D|nr:DOPA 4,5-dioxygenase family protein [Vibrio hepatarius]MBU2898117.1 DOPA 4,5-dioxygenase family protein [Vibrio hepatarius]